jgi:hypothetical protein
MSDLDRISTLRPIYPSEQRQPRRRPRTESETDPPRKKREPGDTADEPDHQVDDYA